MSNDLETSEDTNTVISEEQLYAMSDDEINQLDYSQVSKAEASLEEADETEKNEGGEDEEFEDSSDSVEDDQVGDVDESTDATEDDDFEESDDGVDAEDADTQVKDTESDPSSDEPELDYRAEYERILAPFRANGKEIQVRSVDEAIQLMQMGANYSKKMAGLKPNLKLLKMLENSNMLSEEKLNFYADVEAKNPEAIKKLLKDSDIDPLDLDLEDVDYNPTKRTVDDRQMAVDSVMEDLRDAPTYPELMKVVGRDWDSMSREAIYENPQLLEVINGHMETGVYKVISEELERERLLGKHKGLSDLEAYRTVGDSIHARGGFDHLFQSEQSKPKPKRKTAFPKGKTEDPKVKAKRRAASPTRTSTKAKGPEDDFNPLSLSDEEFEKAFNAKFL